MRFDAESARTAGPTLWHRPWAHGPGAAWLVPRFGFAFVILLFGALLRSVPLLGFGAFVLIAVTGQFWWKRRQ